MNSTQENKAHAVFDIIINGAGLVGSSLALALAHLPLRIGILEARPELATSTSKKLSAPLSARLEDAGGPISLNKSSQQLLAAIGVWQSLASETQVIAQVQLSERGRFGKLRLGDLETKPCSNKLGYVLPRQRLLSELHTQLARTLASKSTEAQFYLVTEAKIQSIKRSTTHQWELSLDHPSHSLSTTLLVAADGHHSHVRQQLAQPSQAYPPEEEALIAWVQRERAHHAIAYERFTAQGTLALLPYLDQSMGLVWTAPSQQIRHLHQLDDDAFLNTVHTLLGPRFGTLSLCSKRTRHPIHRAPPQPLPLPGVVCLGDAAYRLHPVAAQGLNASFQDVITLTDVISAGCTTRHPSYNEGKDAKPLAIDLQHYLNISLSRQKKHWRVTESIRHLFKSPLGPIALARSIGLGISDGLPVFRNACVRHFSGDIL